MSQVTIVRTAIQTLDSGSIEYTGPKGVTRTVHPAAACVMGGKALASLKTAAVEVALKGAENGRYRAAADIMADAFPKIVKGFTDYVGLPWANRASFELFTGKVLAVGAGAKGYTKKQILARAIAAELTRTTFAPAQGEVVGEA